MTTDTIRLCTFRTPPDDRECLEAGWSEFAACAKCPVECYRAGWDVARCEVDNLERVERKGREMDKPQAGIPWQCRIGWHAWGKWTLPGSETVIIYGIAVAKNVLTQARECLHCSAVGKRIVK